MKRLLWSIWLGCLMLSGCGMTAQETIDVAEVTNVAQAATPSSTSQPTVMVEPAASPEPTLEVAATPEPTTEPTMTAEPASTATPKAPLTLEQRTALFNDVWQTINEHYLYSDFNGVDWGMIQAAYAPMIEAAADDAEVYRILARMVEELDDRHSRFAPPEDARSEDALSSGTDTYVGIGVLTNQEPEAALVTMVFADSPAAEAGILRGDRIIGVEGKPFTNTDVIRGPEGSQVRLTVQTPQAAPRELVLTRRPVQGRIIASSQRLPNAPQIGYIYIPSLWADDMHTQVISELKRLRSEEPALAGMIIDLRGNGGGWRNVLEGILSQFVYGDVGEFYSQEAAYPLKIQDDIQAAYYRDLPLVVLIDNNSASYAEVLAGSLQYAGATVIGVPSQGNTETIFQYNFEDGSRLWVAQEGFRLPDGTNFEGSGVQPDYVIEGDWTQYSLPNDPAILSAIAVIEQHPER